VDHRSCQLGAVLIGALSSIGCPGPTPEPDPNPEPPQADAGPARALDWAPPGLGGTIPSPPRNPLTAAGIALGRRLFYDPGLSLDGTVACATCHLQRKAFSDGVPLGSDGVSGRTLGRHAPVLQNLAWHDQGFFWDGGASDLESLVVAPLSHPDEMASEPLDVVDRLTQDTSYVSAFADAFAAAPSVTFLMRAVAQFLRVLVSGTSRYDASVAGELTLNATELRGQTVFERACAACHPPPFFSDHDFHNLGLETEFSDDPEDLRKGRGRITEDEADYGKFKTPSLRNLRAGKPYLHDGRFWTLRQVLERYRSGLPDSPDLDPLLRDAQGLARLELSDTDLDDLEAFLETLHDQQFLNNDAFAEP
jgi:cytochrome c peroxidase